MTGNTDTFEGGCTCGQVRYRLTAKPMFVNCCHCRWCQRQSGTAFATNAIIEADRVETLSGEVETILIPTPSGKGQKIVRCPHCRIAVWSNYVVAGDALRFVRVGSLDEPDRIAPDAHIHTGSKQPWVVLPANVPAFTATYDAATTWPKQSLDRRAALKR